jgi:tetratricopeptide (TPR) repeat protein
LAAFNLNAHDSPEHVISGLTARIEAEPRRADLYWRRATEYRVLGRLEEAAQDLRQALKFQRDYLPALADLSRVQLGLHKKRQALATINRALALVSDEAGRAPLRMLRAEILSEAGDWRAALADCDAAIRQAGDQEVDWYLTRSQIHYRLGRVDLAVAGLKEGIERTGNAVLEVEYVEALIDAGQFKEASEKIGPFLQESRWQSAWLIRRARVRLARGEISDAQADLLAALQELGRRLNSSQRDSTLVLERGMAYALLGDIALAKRDFKTAKQSGADPVGLHRLELTVAQNNVRSIKTERRQDR